ncbi:hypothetical protein ACMFMG_006796 [Clarireedia jacksonii]
MFSRTIRRSLLDIRTPSATLPPTFLLPSRARFFNSTTQHVEPPVERASTSKTVFNAPIAPPKSAAAPTSTPIPTVPAPSTTPAPLSAELREMLPLLAAQPSHFISAHIYDRPYLVTPGDIIRLPFLMPGVAPGDILRLNRASSLGSRDYTLKGTPYLDERIFECRARVMGTEAEPMRIKEKKKRRISRTRTVKKIKIKTAEEIEGTV